MTQFNYQFDETTNPLSIVVSPDLITSEPDSVWKDTSAVDKVVQKVVDLSEEATASAFSAIFHMARYTSQLIRRLRETDPDVPLDTVQMQFGLKFTGTTSIIIVDTTAEANVLVTLSWKEK